MEKITKPPKKPEGVKRLLNTNDIHLLHKRVPTWHIVDVIREILISCENTLDAFYITGDLFDDSPTSLTGRFSSCGLLDVVNSSGLRPPNTAVRIVEEHRPMTMASPK
ncbi:hypothetical protein N5V81_14130 [Escherichia coli]|nr:hypothetical protein [Escherichia coli]